MYNSVYVTDKYMFVYMVYPGKIVTLSPDSYLKVGGAAVFPGVDCPQSIPLYVCPGPSLAFKLVISQQNSESLANIQLVDVG